MIRTSLETLYFTGAYQMLRPLVAGVGVILTLHHVRPRRPERFQPNRLLEVTPRFLEQVVRYLKRCQLDLVSLDEMHRRLAEGDFRRRFVCITIDDGYRDTLNWAYPILRRHAVPFALYIPTSFPDRLGELWWLALEAVVARNRYVSLLIDGRERSFDCGTVAEKRDLCDELCMNWEELGRLASDPLVTIGAHTVNHVMLAKVPERSARAEMEMSRSVIEASLGTRPQHLSYPVGDRTSAGPREFKIAAELGFKTAVTTRPGVLFASHRQHLTALPRISLNGEHQQLRYVRVLASGAATAVWNRFREVDAA